MPDSSLITTIITSGGVGIACTFVLVLAGWLIPKWAYDKERERADRLERANADLQAALDAERQAVTEVSGTASTTNALISALVDLARSERPPVLRERGGDEPLALTPAPPGGR